MTRLIPHLAICASLSLLASLPAHAQTGNATADLLLQAAGQAQKSGMLGNLGGNQPGTSSAPAGLADLGALLMPSLAGSSAGNVAGLLEYCVRHNYLKKASIENLQTQLLAFAGIPPSQPQQDPGYNLGLSGLLSNSGQGLNLDTLKTQATEKACDYILRSATSLF